MRPATASWLSIPRRRRSRGAVGARVGGSTVGAGSALLLVSALLGAADAASALWANRALTSVQVVLLCLSAPLPMALLLLAPGALASAVCSALIDLSRRGRPPRQDGEPDLPYLPYLM